MESLYNDWELLEDDLDRVERIAATDSETVTKLVTESVRQRWAISDNVAQESIRAALAAKFGDWFDAAAESGKKKLDNLLDVSKGLENKLADLETKVNGAGTRERKIATKRWGAKLCIGGDIALGKSIKLMEHPTTLDDVIDPVTVFRTPITGKVKQISDDGFNLKPFDTLNSAAIRRAMGLGDLLGLHTAGKIYMLPGNVYVGVTALPFGKVARYSMAKSNRVNGPDEIPSLNKEEAIKYLKAGWKCLEYIKSKNAKRGLFKFKAQFEATMQKAEDEELSKAEQRALRLQFKNMVVIEDALITSYVRVCQGIIDYVRFSL